MELGSNTPVVKKAIWETTPSVTGVIPSSYTEDKVGKFYEDHKGNTLKDVIAILGLPLDRWTVDDTTYLKYAIQGKFGSPHVGIDFSGFVLKFRDGRLRTLANRYGHISK